MMKYLRFLVPVIFWLTTAPASIAQFYTAGAVDNKPEDVIGPGKHVVGQNIAINGVPACIIFLDENGHGLACSVPAKTKKALEEEYKAGEKAKSDAAGIAKKTKSAIAKQCLDKGYYIDFDKVKQSQWLSKKKKPDLMSGLIERLGTSGAENHKAVKEYAKEKSLDLNDAFPAQAYCESLGEGWFIPGNDELVKLSQFLFGHYGKKDDFAYSNVSENIGKITTNPELYMIQASTGVNNLNNADLSAIPAYMFTYQNLTADVDSKLRGGSALTILSSSARDPKLGFMALSLNKGNNAFLDGSYTEINDGVQGKETVLESMIIPVFAF